MKLKNTIISILICSVVALVIMSVLFVYYTSTDKIINDFKVNYIDARSSDYFKFLATSRTIDEVVVNQSRCDYEECEVIIIIKGELEDVTTMRSILLQNNSFIPNYKVSKERSLSANLSKFEVLEIFNQGTNVDEDSRLSKSSYRDFSEAEKEAKRNLENEEIANRNSNDVVTIEDPYDKVQFLQENLDEIIEIAGPYEEMSDEDKKGYDLIQSQIEKIKLENNIE